MILTAILAGVQLASAIVERLPERDPELRRLQVEHRQAMDSLRSKQRHERRMARLARKP